jgi:hypothetical protein
MKKLLLFIGILLTIQLVIPSAIHAQCSILPLEQFTTNANFSTGAATTVKYWSPASCTTGGLLYSASGGCTAGYVGKTGSWNNYFGCFLRTPQANCTGNAYVTLNFDISNSYFAAHPNDKMRFYMWVDGAYKKASSIKIGGIEVGFNDINGLWLKFDQARTCVNVDVVFDLTTCSNLSNILFYLEPNCGYNDGNVFSVVIDNISLNGALPTADAGANDTICAGTSAQLNATGGGTYAWSPSSGLSSATIANPIANPAATTTYTVTVSGTCGIATDTVVLTVNPLPATPVITQSNDTLFSNVLYGNQWYNSSGPIIGATGNFYTPPSKDNFYVIVTDNNGCVSDTSNAIYYDVTGISTAFSDKGQIRIYPNPASDRITIENTDANKCETISIYDTEGRILMNSPLNPGRHEKDISFLARGIYFVKVLDEKGISFYKFVKE